MMDALLRNKLTMVSGWGTGLSVLFVMFNETVSLGSSPLGLLDNLLSVSVVVFFLLTVSAVAIGLHGAGERVWLRSVSWFKRIQGVVISATLLGGGWLLLDYAPHIKGAAKTAAALGTCLAGAGAIAVYFVVIKLCTRR